MTAEVIAIIAAVAAAIWFGILGGRWLANRYTGKPPEPAPVTRDEADRRASIRQAGPGQPCMSRIYVTPMTSAVCGTGHPAGTPHEHRAVDHYGQTAKAPWGTATMSFGNPFEDDDLARSREAWLKAAPLNGKDLR